MNELAHLLEGVGRSGADNHLIHPEGRGVSVGTDSARQGASEGRLGEHRVVVHVSD